MPRGQGKWSGAGEIPLFGSVTGSNDERDDSGGFVLSPAAFGGSGGVLCGYPYDPHTFNYVCVPPGISDTCVPGCCCGGSDSAPAWVKGFIGEHSYFQDAYRPEALRQMLADYVRRPGGGRDYNEVIVSQERWGSQLSTSFDAFFFPDTPNCRRRAACEAYTRRAHADFRRQFPTSTVPLLTLNPSSWEAPFAVADDEVY